MSNIKDIQISLVNSRKRAWLSLNGTILTYCDKALGRDSIIDIPVELITVKEIRRFKGIRLIVTLLWLFIFPIGGVIIHVPDQIEKLNHHPARIIFTVLGISIVFIPFFVLLFRFFIRQKAVSLIVDSQKMNISFWLEKKNRDTIRNFLKELEIRNKYVHEKISYPLQSAIGEVITQPWLRAVAMIFLSAIPAIITEIPILFLLCIIPVVLQIRCLLIFYSHPRLFRNAIRSCLRRKWDDARMHLERLIQKSPSYIPAHLLLLKVLLRIEKYDEATVAINRIQDHVDADKLQTPQLEFVERKRLSERKKMTVQPEMEQ